MDGQLEGKALSEGKLPDVEELTIEEDIKDDLLSPHSGTTLTLEGRGNAKRDLCPLADVSASLLLKASESLCPFHRWKHQQVIASALSASSGSTPSVATTTATCSSSSSTSSCGTPAVSSSSAGMSTASAGSASSSSSPPRPITLYQDRYGDYDRTMESSQLLRELGGGQRILEMTTRFYAHAFLDSHIKELFFKDDGAGAHGDRLGHWIVQFMGGEGNPWDDSGREGMRQATHAAAWMSPRRTPARRGRRFKLDDCRIWMRLMFWAGREVGLMSNPTFASWYTQFIGHFIRIYEATAPPYAAKDAAWSADPRNVALYLESGHVMKDVIGVGSPSY